MVSKEVRNDYKQAAIAVTLVFAVSSGIATIPKAAAQTGDETEKAPPVSRTYELYAQDKPMTFPEVTEVESYEEAVEKGLDVVAYEDMTEEEAAARGYESYTFSDGTRVWYAKRAFGSLHAHDDGSLNEYDEGYFVAHAGTTYGNGIANLYPGAVVNVNGRQIVIEGYTYSNYNNEGLGYLRDRVGWDKVCFQTCTDNNGNVIVYYGRYTDGSSASPTYEAQQKEYAARWAAHEKYLAENAAQKAQWDAENEAKKAASAAAAKKAAEEQAAWEAQQAAKKAAEEQAQVQAEAEAQARAQAEAEAVARAQAAAQAAAEERAAQQAAQQASNSSNSGSSSGSGSSSNSSSNANAA